MSGARSEGPPGSWWGLAVGPLAALAVWALLHGAPDLTPGGRATAAVAVLMAVWWLTEALPLPVTALVPIVLLPLTGAADVRAATAPYASKVIYLFLGGFVLGLGLQRWGLHRRIALRTILLVGTGPRRIVAGFMVATAVLSMWVSNTATTVMMTPIGASVAGLLLRRLREEGGDEAQGRAFATCLLLGIAYAASIGGVGTLIGTPPNAVLKGFVEDTYGVEISFAGWLLVGLPLVIVFLPLAWLWLTARAFPVRLRSLPGGRQVVAEELARLGPMSRGEWTVLVVFCLAALGWVLRGRIVAWTGLTGLTDEGIAVAAALALFVVPVEPRTRTFAMDWETARRLPWGVLLLFGGGLSLAAAIRDNGVDRFLGAGFSALEGLPAWALVAAVVLLVVFLTELTSNTAVTTTLLPVLAAAATALALAPAVLLVPAAVAASCAFMLPVATPPNAIVFGSGHVTLRQMARAGLALNLLGVVVVTLVVYGLGVRVLGMTFGG